jgi:hypothetical protein
MVAFKGETLHSSAIHRLFLDGEKNLSMDFWFHLIPFDMVRMLYVL